MNRAGPIKRTAMKPYRPTVTAEERTGRPLVVARSGGWCEIRMDGVCLGRASDWHHRKNRSQGGRWLASNGLHACRACHYAVTNTEGHRAEYEDKGWIVPGQVDPHTVPALIHTATLGHTYVLLDDDGMVQLAPWPEHVDSDPFELAPPRGTSAATPSTAA